MCIYCVINPFSGSPLLSQHSPDGVPLIDQEGLGIGCEHRGLPNLDLIVRVILLDVTLGPIVVILRDIGHLVIWTS